MAKKGKRKAAEGDLASNRQASFRYHLLEKIECGVILQGSEVKSIRDGGVQIKDAYAHIDKNGRVWLENMHVAPYLPASRENHEPERPRELLLHAAEIEQLIGSTAQKGLTLVPTRVYLKGSRVKVEIAVGRGKDQGDKRRDLKAKDQRREIDRAIAERQR
jgi:SsrA-binding protein